MNSETVWTFKTARFEIRLEIEEEPHYRYDGDDENGETQAKLDSGEYIAFTSKVCVDLDGIERGNNFLSGSVYIRNAVSQFWTAHRSPDPGGRNCTIMRAKWGANHCICHYFPDMVREAVKEARDYIRDMDPIPYIREDA